MRTIPVIWGIATVVIALFLLQLGKRLSAGRTNPVAESFNSGLMFLLNG